MEDYYRNKAASEYLDYDRETLFRKNKLYCGIRNIDNSKIFVIFRLLSQCHSTIAVQCSMVEGENF